MIVLEEAWRHHPLGRDRGAGGRRSLSGFSYQLALSLDQLLTTALSGSLPDELLFDSLGDLTRLEEGAAYLIQIKATLTLERSRGAVREALAVDAFLAEQFPDLRDSFQFGVWCRRREGTGEPRELTAGDLGLTGDDVGRWEEVRTRVLPAEIRADPYLAIVLRLFPLSQDPFGLADALRGTLLRLLGEDTPSDHIVFELLRLVSESRRPSEVSTPGRLLRPEDFVRTDFGSTYTLIGDRPRLEDLVDGCFMPRRDRLQQVMEVLTPLLDGGVGGEAPRRTLPVVWLDGTSGSGKSVLLLQVLEYLLLERDIPVHLLPPSSSQRLPEALEFWSRARRPGIIAVDDVYAPESRQGEIWRRVHELSFDGRWAAPLVLLTCGPPDYRRAFEEEVRRGGGLELMKVPLAVLDVTERTDYSAWYTQRTGHPVKTIGEGNFATAAFLYHLQREGGAADLGQFAQRLADRLESRGILDEVLAVILGTSLGFLLPESLFLGKEDDREALIREGLFRRRATEDGSQVLIFLHPKLAGRIFEHLVPLEEVHRRTGYLVHCFLVVRPEPERARVFLGLLGSVDLGERERALALEKIWSLLAEREHPDLEISVIWTWHEVARAVSPGLVRNVLDRVSDWLESPELDAGGWGVLWQIGWDAGLPSPPEALVQGGRDWLQRNLDVGPWNYIWQRLWKYSEKDAEMAEMAEVWLELNSDHPGWSYVFNTLVDSGWRSPMLTSLGLLGLRQIPTNIADPYLWPRFLTLGPDRADFLQAIVDRLCRCNIGLVLKKGADFVKAFCQSLDDLDLVAKRLEEGTSRDLSSLGLFWQNLVRLFKPTVPSSLWEVGWNWLSGREGRADWAYVWELLLELASSEKDRAELWSLGREWLSGREDRAEWNYVWRYLLEWASSEEDRAELWSLGRDWLSGHEDRADWAYVWERLLEMSQRDEDLYQLGFTWLQGREKRREWSYIWQYLARYKPTDSTLIDIARAWLSEERPVAAAKVVSQRLAELELLARRLSPPPRPQ